MNRKAIAACCLSAAAFVGLLSHEGYTEHTIVPTKNDRPTNGFGSTFDENGKPIQMGDKTNPIKALQRSHMHILKDEAGIKKCVTGELAQHEYDTLISFAYQYGTGATCKSAMVKHINAGEYEKACEAYLLYNKSGGYDCSTLIHGKPNKRCYGVWERQLERKAKCMGAT